MFVEERLIIPIYKALKESLFRIVHDELRHFGANKTYTTLCYSYYWPNICQDLINSYIPSYADCQWNKSRTTKLAGLLHPLPIPEHYFSSVTLDFIGPLPRDEGFD